MNEGIHRDKRILVSWYTDPAYIPPFMLSNRQTTVGPKPQHPGMPTVFDGHSPPGAYDLHAVLAAQGLDTDFDAIVVWSDATLTNLPLNLGAFRCPKVLCAGDTQHQDKPLRKMLDYAVQAGFDYIVSSHNRHHLHWFAEAGKPRVAWIPALKVQHIPRPLTLPRQACLAFVGQAGRFHPRRLRLLEALQRHAVPIQAKSGNRAMAADLYASSVLSFNASLNGDLNLRVFEIMSAGGCLLTDRLGQESGLSQILEEGREFIGYDSIGELIEKARFYLDKPDAALAIATAGQRAYVERLRPERQIDILLRWIFEDRIDRLHQASWDPRPAIAARAPAPLPNRLQLYEFIQELHKNSERTRVLFSSGVPLCHIADVLDLHRLDAAVLASVNDGPRLLACLGLGHSVSSLDRRLAEAIQWDCIVATAADVGTLSGIPRRSIIQI